MALSDIIDRYVREDVAAVYDRLPEEVKAEFADLDIPAIIEANFRYINPYGLSRRDLTRWREVVEQWAAYMGRRPKTPLPGDRIVLTATGSIQGNTRTFHNALVTSGSMHHSRGNGGDAYVCTEPYVPFLDFIAGQPSLDVSGGYFKYAPATEFKFLEKREGDFKFFPCGCRADGALYLKLPVYWWTLTSDLFY